MKTIYFSDADDPIDIRYDNVFKAVFTRDTPGSKTALSDLVSALIGRNVSIVEILANEPPADNIHDRRIRFDINCRAEDGEPVNVEMSLDPDPFEPVRLEYYAGKLFTGQNISGTDKSYDDLKYAYQIAILAQNHFFDDDDFFHIFEYYDFQRSVSLNGRSRIITIELSKLEKVAEKPVAEMSVKEYWAFFFRYLTDKEKRRKINEILEKEEGIAMASEVLMTISRDEHERARLLSEFKGQKDYESKMVYAKRTGHAEGRAEGRIEGRAEGRMEGRIERELEIARKMKGIGDSIEKIQAITGLPLETIEQM